MTTKLRISSRAVVLTLFAVVFVGVVGAGVFIYSGLYDVAASSPHLQIERMVITALKRRSITRRTEGVSFEPSMDAKTLQKGLILYRRHCVNCHGGPGEAPSRSGIGVNPLPPPLLNVARRWSPEEIYWIIENGLKFTGMPAFGLGTVDVDIAAITSFVLRMNTLSPGEYFRMVEAVEGSGVEESEVHWEVPDTGWSELEELGSPARGHELIVELGCGACHRVPGIGEAKGEVGPPLTHWSKRHYVGGRVPNTPAELVRWLSDPLAVDPHTAMPHLGLTEAQALDISAYLYTIE